MAGMSGVARGELVLSVSGAMCAAGALLLVGCSDGSVIAVEAASGEQRWVMAVAAPVIGSLLLAVGSQAGSARWLLGLPFFFCAALQAASTVLAFRHFRRSRLVAAAA